jgi:hypothetical protein
VNDRDHSRLAEHVLRVRGNLSYSQLATKTGLTKAVLHKAATGGSVSPTTLQAIAVATGEDPDLWYEIGGYPELVRDHAAQQGAENYESGKAGWAGMVCEAPERFDDEDALLDRLFGCWGFDPPEPGARRERLKRTIKALVDVDALE